MSRYDQAIQLLRWAERMERRHGWLGTRRRHFGARSWFGRRRRNRRSLAMLALALFAIAKRRQQRI